METTTVFYYKGFVGIKSHPDSDALIAKPGNGNLGCVCDASKVKISPEALKALKKVKKCHDDIGDVDIFETSGGMVVFSWLGGYLKAFRPENVEGSRTYDTSLLKASDDVEIPDNFKEFVDKKL